MNTYSFKTQHNSKLKDCSWTKVQSAVFSQFCNDNDIRQTMFRTSGGSKTILAIAVRFNRTLRIKIAKQVKLHGNKERKILIRAASKFFPQTRIERCNCGLTRE